MLTVAALVAGMAAGNAQTPPAPASQNSNSNTNQVAMVQVRLLNEDGLPGPVISSPKVVKTDAEWAKQLTPEQYKITRAKGTEPAFCGAFFDQHKSGIYYCICCDLPLFTS